MQTTLDADRHRAPARARDADQHRPELRRRVPPRREHGALGAPFAAARRARPARDRERRQPRLPGRVPRRRGPPRDGLVGHRGRGQAAEVPAHVPRLRRSCSSTRSTCCRTSTSTSTASSHNLDAVHPGVERLLVSARTGEGVEAFRATGSRASRPGSASRCERADVAARARGRGAARARRIEASERFFAAEAERIARLCRALAERFVRGGRLLALGGSPQDWSDAHHVAVEFVHPVIVGKRALPALALSRRSTSRLLRRAGRHVSPSERRWRARRRARRGWELASPSRRATIRSCARSWPRRSTTCSGSSCTSSSSTSAGSERGRRRLVGFLYPFLGAGRGDLEPVVDDVRRSVLMKARGVGELRARTLREGGDALVGGGGGVRAAGSTRGGKRAGVRQRRLGDRRDATLVADLRAAPQGWPAGRALDLAGRLGDPDGAGERHRPRGAVLSAR